MADEKTPKIPKKYVCEVCAFTSSNKKDYNKHLLTDKHKTNMNADKCLQITPENTSENCDKFVCMCGKSYKHRQSLFRHQTKCNYKPETTIQQPVTNEFVLEALTNITTQFTDALKDIAPKLGNNNTTNSNNTNNTNQFNINVFLNEDCKNAINMSDFIKSIEVSLEQLDFTKTKGLEKGITQVIMDNMNKLSVHERPLHCTDTKRETLYIKDDNKWEKDKNKKKIKEVIKKASNKNYTALQNWRKENPDYLDDDSKAIYYAKAMSAAGKPIDAVDEKIIKNVCKQTYVKEDLKE